VALILVVEDHAANLKLARLVLEKAGHEVIAANNATDGIALASCRKPALILMDIQLPGIDGIEATKRLKADASTAAIPVIALTASAMPSDQPRMIAAGCNGYLAKPVRAAVLLATVDRWLHDLDSVHCR